MENKDGGPAFPFIPKIKPSDDGRNAVIIGYSGMSLRDYFAAAAWSAEYIWMSDKLIQLIKECK